MYGMDYLPEVVQAGNINGFQRGLEQTCEWQSPKGVLEEANIDSMWSGVQGGPAGPEHGAFVDRSPGLDLSQWTCLVLQSPWPSPHEGSKDSFFLP